MPSVFVVVYICAQFALSNIAEVKSCVFTVKNVTFMFFLDL